MLYVAFGQQEDDECIVGGQRGCRVVLPNHKAARKDGIKK
jgi:hypothetical protein